MSRSSEGLLVAALVLLLAGCSHTGAADADAMAVSTGRMIGSGLAGPEISLAFRPRPDPGRVGAYGYGEPATPEQIAGWNIDVRPDGLGLPPGSGTVLDGEPLYDEKCAACHGIFGQGEGRWPKLAGGVGALTQERPERTVGSYWPYATTLWDYVRRTMPFFEPQSLTDDEVYAITAYVLHLNDLVTEDFELSRENLPSVQMPNREGFFEDPRPDVQNTVCMADCRHPSEIRIAPGQE